MLRLAVALAVAPAAAALTLPRIFSDGLVLMGGNANERPFLYGYGMPGEVVSVTRTWPNGIFDTFSATVDADEFFITALPSWPTPEGASGLNNLTLTVSGSFSPGEVITITNVVYGEVFVCSGQSNMALSVEATFGANETMAGTYPFRLYSAPTVTADAPQRDLAPSVTNGSATPCNLPYQRFSKQACNTWQAADEPTVIGGFSAVCFYTALELSRHLPAGTVFGLVHASYVGTPMEAWAPPEALAQCHDDPPGPPGPIPRNYSVLWNAMIHPLARLGIRGVLWNQGEANMGDSRADFGCLFQAMIGAWRAHWRLGDFGFHFVQLGNQPGTLWPVYWFLGARLGQSDALPGRSKTLYTSMAVAYDVGDITSVHARNKSVIGQRLGRALLHAEYAWGWPTGTAVNSSTPALNWAPPRITAFASADGGATYTVAFETLDGRGITRGDTHDCWQCCAAGADDFQLGTSQYLNATWVNATFTLGPPGADGVVTSVVLTPANRSLAFAAARFAANLWPQCTVFGAGNELPLEPFEIAIPFGGGSDAGGRSDALPPMLPPAPVVVVPADAATAAAATATAASSLGWPDGWRGVPVPPRSSFLATPPLGFNTWFAFACSADERVLREVADALVATGLAAAGYTRLNLDGCWAADRAQNGSIIAHESFPSGMAAAAAYVHGRGLQFGLYTSRTEYECAGRPGSWRFEDVDTDTYCGWGVDYLKVDDCGGRDYAAANTSWLALRAGIERCVAAGGRRMALSVEYCRDASCGAWVGAIANLWRTTDDLRPDFRGVMATLDANDAMAPFAGPGHWNDPDILQVGNPGLSPDESRSHFGAWAVVAAPLLISTDVRGNVSADTLATLSAPEVLAVSQDALGIQGTRVSAANASGAECWARPLAGGAVAALLLNRGDAAPADVSCSWAQLGLKDPAGHAAVRDLWARADLGDFVGGFTARAVAPHASRLVRVAPAAATMRAAS